jgi:hypothetical protein
LCSPIVSEGERAGRSPLLEALDVHTPGDAIRLDPEIDILLVVLNGDGVVLCVAVGGTGNLHEGQVIAVALALLVQIGDEEVRTTVGGRLLHEGSSFLMWKTSNVFVPLALPAK